MEQTDRITAMEQCFDRARQAVSQLDAALDQYAQAQADLRQLQAYYGSAQCKKDFADDEAGLLPKDQKRGVLSEDGIWNLLSDNSLLLEKLSKTCACGGGRRRTPRRNRDADGIPR